jgi:hypothetical protein
VDNDPGKDASSRKLVDKSLAATMGAPVSFVLPEGATDI